MKRKEDPRHDHRAGALHRRHPAARHAPRGDRALAGGARGDHLDRHLGGQGAPPASSRVFTGEDLAGDFAGADARWSGRRPAWRSRPRSTGRSSAARSSTSATRSPSSWRPSRGSGVDAAEEVIVEYDPQARRWSTPSRRSRTASPLVWEEFGTNKTHEWAVAGGDFDAALAEADVTVEQRASSTTAPSGAPIEPRCSIAEPRGDKLTLYSTTQIPHIARFVLSRHARHRRGQAARGRARRRRRLRRRSCRSTPRRRSCCALAKRLRAPGQVDRDALGAHDHEPPRARPDQLRHARRRSATARSPAAAPGSSPTWAPTMQLLTPFIPTLGFPVMGGCYTIPAIDLHITGVFTNKMSHRRDPRRRAAGGDLLDRADDGPARATSSAWTRSSCGARTSSPRTSSRTRPRSGSSTTRATTRARSTSCSRSFDLDAFRARAGGAARAGRPPRRRASRPTSRSAASRRRGRSGPQGVGLQAAFYESANVRVHPTGSATVYTGTSPHGQGLDTSFAQIAGRPARDRPGERRGSCTATPTRAPWGWGTYGSRSLVGRAARRSPARRARCRTRPSGSARRCSRPRPRTSSWPTASTR